MAVVGAREARHVALTHRWVVCEVPGVGGHALRVLGGVLVQHAILQPEIDRLHIVPAPPNT